MAIDHVFTTSTIAGDVDLISGDYPFNVKAHAPLAYMFRDLLMKNLNKENEKGNHAEPSDFQDRIRIYTASIYKEDLNQANELAAQLEIKLCSSEMPWDVFQIGLKILGYNTLSLIVE